MSLFKNFFRPPDVDQLEKNRDLEGLIKVLGYPDKNLTKKSAEALGRIGDPRAVGPLISALERSGRSGNYEPEYQALKKIKTPAVLPLIKVLNSAVPSECRYDIIIRLLGEIGDPRAVKPIINAVQIRPQVWMHDHVLKEAARALKEIGDPHTLDLLIPIAKETKSLVEVRKFAIVALGEIGDPRAVDPLIEISKEISEGSYDNYSLIYPTILSLQKIGDERAIEPLLALANSRRYGDTEDIVNAIGEIGGSHAIESLQLFLQDKWSDDVKRSAAKMLEKMGRSELARSTNKMLDEKTKKFDISKPTYSIPYGANIVIKCPACGEKSAYGKLIPGDPILELQCISCGYSGSAPVNIK